ncbi:TetR/AcrR family transcriptional regulator [Spongiibacter sp. UBA1325]|uniref:TetR/AcrR family transcriptional regulator n=1 Tax=Spongiibacter sp. UBA1325 TaxID=1947543 RepID=UPI00257CC4D7|nr:TetR/AcrR family transcriptional regulator [Spongiibacter sp. UBA1325]
MALTEKQIQRIENRKKQSRDKITSSALKLFEKQGIANTSVVDIVKASGVAHKTFFNHFKNKDELMIHLATEAATIGDVFFAEALAVSDEPRLQIEHALMGMAQAFVPVNQTYRELINYYFISGSHRDMRNQQRNHFQDNIRAILTTAKDDGKLVDDNNFETYMDVLVGVFISLIISWNIEDAFPIEARMEGALKLVNDSIFRAI